MATATKVTLTGYTHVAISVTDLEAARAFYIDGLGFEELPRPNFGVDGMWLRVGSHALFGRRGKDLTITVPVTFAEAALGAEVKVPTLAEPVTLRVPAGTSTGKTFRVRGRGVPQARGGAGDLLVTVDVAVPKNLSKAEREAIEALAEVSTESPRGHLGV